MSTHSGHAQKPSTSTVSSTRKRRGDEERGSEATMGPSKDEDAELHTLLLGGWDRFTRKGKKNIGVLPSLKAFMRSSCMYLMHYHVLQCSQYFVAATRVDVFHHFHPDSLGWTLPEMEFTSCILVYVVSFEHFQGAFIHEYGI